MNNNIWKCQSCGHKHEIPNIAENLWKELMKEAYDCKRVWGMGFPVISTSLLKKYWQKATGYLPK